MTFQLSEPKLEGLAIRVQDLEAMIAFYQKLPGFYKLTEENNLAYFGGAKEGDAFLILEDTPFGAQEAGGVKKLARFSLSVPDLTQLKYVKNHLSKQGVKILQEEWSVGQGAFTIADPEENYLTFFVDHRLPADDLHPAAVQFQLQQNTS